MDMSYSSASSSAKESCSTWRSVQSWEAFRSASNALRKSFLHDRLVVQKRSTCGFLTFNVKVMNAWSDNISPTCVWLSLVSLLVIVGYWINYGTETVAPLRMPTSGNVQLCFSLTVWNVWCTYQHRFCSCCALVMVGRNMLRRVRNCLSYFYYYYYYYYTTPIKYTPCYKSILFHFFHFFLLITFSIRSACLKLLNSANTCQNWIIGKCWEIIAYKLRRWILSMTVLYTQAIRNYRYNTMWYTKTETWHWRAEALTQGTVFFKASSTNPLTSGKHGCMHV